MLRIGRTLLSSIVARSEWDCQGQWSCVPGPRVPRGRVQLVFSPWIRQRRPSSCIEVPVTDDNDIFGHSLHLVACCYMADRVDRNLLTLAFPKVWLISSMKLSVRVKLIVAVNSCGLSLKVRALVGRCRLLLELHPFNIHTFFPSQFSHLLSCPSFLILTLKNLQSVPLPCLALGRDPHSLCTYGGIWGRHIYRAGSILAPFEVNSVNFLCCHLPVSWFLLFPFCAAPVSSSCCCYFHSSSLFRILMPWIKVWSGGGLGIVINGRVRFFNTVWTLFGSALGVWRLNEV